MQQNNDDTPVLIQLIHEVVKQSRQRTGQNSGKPQDFQLPKKLLYAGDKIITKIRSVTHLQACSRIILRPVEKWAFVSALPR